MSDLIDICPVEELPPGEHRLVTWEELEIGIFNCNGELLYGTVDAARCSVECPRHGSVFDLRTGRPLNLPAYEPVDTFPVTVRDGVIRLEVD